MVNDVENNKLRLPLEEIKVPTLITHGDKDKSVPLTQAEQAKNLISGAELYVVEGGSHILPFHAKYQDLVNKQVEFAGAQHNA